MLTCLAISGYRSLRDLTVALGRLNIVTGANGSGKSSLYRALRLLSDVALGRAIAALAQEGELASTLWAGPETISRDMRSGAVPVQGGPRRGAVSLELGFATAEFSYALDLGLPIPSATRFGHDPEIKGEVVWTGPVLGRANAVAERRNAHTRIRSDDTGVWRDSFDRVAPVDSMMTHCADAGDGLELLLLRERMRAWRFYDQLRTDRDAPSRRPQVGTFTPVLSSDGADLGAALQTIIEIGDSDALGDAIDDAFDGATIRVGNQFEVEMQQHGLLRALTAGELSDGTLRYILLVAALLSPRPPELMVLNEPEASLHPDLLAPLARLLVKASERCQLLIVSHSQALVSALDAAGDATTIHLTKVMGETVVVGDERPAWTWPTR